jgi:Protein of unknown function (DUF2384)
MRSATTASSIAEKAIGQQGRVNVVKLASELDIPLDALAGAFKKSRRYLHMEPKAKSVQTDAVKIVRMVDELAEHLGERRFALFWLKTPQPEFRGKTPIDYLRDGHLDLVLGLAHDIVFMVPD